VSQTPAPTDAGTPKFLITPNADAQDRESSAQLKTVSSNTSVAGSSKSIVTSPNSNGMSAVERQRVKRGFVRSGSITEIEVNTDGVRKFVLEATSSGDDDSSESNKGSPTSPSQGLEDVKEESKPGDSGATEEQEQNNSGSSQGQSKKKNRRKKRKGGK
jgi:hypothetical protein